MTTKDVFNLQPGELAVRLTKKEIGIIFRALDGALNEVENQRLRYIQRNVIGTYNDIISSGLAVQSEEITNLKHALDNGEKEL